MASWIAYKTTGETIGRYYSVASMKRDLSRRLEEGDEFKAASTQGARHTFKVTHRSAKKVESYVPPSKRRKPPAQLALPF